MVQYSVILKFGQITAMFLWSTLSPGHKTDWTGESLVGPTFPPFSPQSPTEQKVLNKRNTRSVLNWVLLKTFIKGQGKRKEITI